MDFSQLDTRTASDAGAFLHLRHPITGEPLYDKGEAVGVYLRGMESRTVTEEMRKAGKAKLIGEPLGLKLIQSLVIRFVGVEREEGVLLGTTPKDIAWFIGLSSSFEEQIINFAQDRSSFFGDSSTG
jgi:hypothetical protein